MLHQFKKLHQFKVLRYTRQLTLTSKKKIMLLSIEVTVMMLKWDSGILNIYPDVVTCAALKWKTRGSHIAVGRCSELSELVSTTV